MKKNVTQEEIEGYRKKLADQVYMENAIGKIADDLTDKICRANLNKNSEIKVAEKPLIRRKKMAKLSLNEHLFEVLENLTDKSVKGEELDEYVKRSESAIKVAQQIIANNNSMLNAIKVANDFGFTSKTFENKLKLITE